MDYVIRVQAQNYLPVFGEHQSIGGNSCYHAFFRSDRVLETPVPLSGEHAHGNGFGIAALNIGQGLPADDGEPQHDANRDNCPENLQSLIAFHISAMPAFALAATENDNAI